MTLTRKELYALVWSEPIQKIAPRYGLSDRGLGRLCARYNIPVPPRGYWAKKAAAKRIKQTPLHVHASRATHDRVMRIFEVFLRALRSPT